MLRLLRSLLQVGLLFCALRAATSFGQMTIDCERIDSGVQHTGLSGTHAVAQSTASLPYQVVDTDWDYNSDDCYAAIGENSAANTVGNYANATFAVTAEDVIPQYSTVAVPQITMGFGGVFTAHAVHNDTYGWAWAAGGLNMFYDTWDVPGYAQGLFEVLGDDQDATLFGELDIIITISLSGEGGVASDDWWQIGCGGSSLTGVRNGDGWDVTGNLKSVGNTDLEVDEFWPDNVNEAIFVTELTHSGEQHGLSIYIDRMRMNCWAASDAQGGPDTSALNTSFSFTSYFEIEEDDM